MSKSTHPKQPHIDASLCDLFTQNQISRDDFKQWLAQALESLNATLQQQEYTYTYGWDWQHDYSRDEDYALTIRQRQSNTVQPDYAFTANITERTHRDSITILTETTDDIDVKPAPETVLIFGKRQDDFSFEDIPLPVNNLVAKNQILIAIEEHLIDRAFRDLTCHFCLPENERDEQAKKRASHIMKKAGLIDLYEDTDLHHTGTIYALPAPK